MEAFGGLVKGAATLETSKAVDAVVQHVLGATMDTSHKELNAKAVRNMLGALRQQLGYGVYVSVEYEKCESCTSWNPGYWFNGCDEYQFKSRYHWVQCTEGSELDAGLYGGQGKFAHITRANLNACIAKALR